MGIVDRENGISKSIGKMRAMCTRDYQQSHVAGT